MNLRLGKWQRILHLCSQSGDQYVIKHRISLSLTNARLLLLLLYHQLMTRGTLDVRSGCLPSRVDICHLLGVRDCECCQRWRYALVSCKNIFLKAFCQNTDLRT